MVFNFPPFNSCFLQSARHLGMMVPLIYCMQRTAKITCKVELIDFPHVVSELRFSGEKILILVLLAWRYTVELFVKILEIISS